MERQEKRALTHLDERGQAIMVDVSEKAVTARTAVACGKIRMSGEALRAVTEGSVPKGDVLAAARIAGILAVKCTSELIPLCHPLPVGHCAVELCADEEACAVEAICTVKVTGQTGAEMEALTGVTIALLTVYDMCKALDKRMEITDVHLLRKSGGKSGDFAFDAGEAQDGA